MAWHIIEKLLEEVAKHSTFVGKVWITAIFLFRIVVVTRICDTVYHDEQAAFRCNIKQPGCENVCFNRFSPLSHVRFWGFEIIAVSLPSIIFIVYAAHEVARKFSKGTPNAGKFGTIKGPIARIGPKITCKNTADRNRTSSIRSNKSLRTGNERTSLAQIDEKESPVMAKFDDKLSMCNAIASLIKQLFKGRSHQRTICKKRIRFSRKIDSLEPDSKDLREKEVKKIEIHLCRGYILQSAVRLGTEVVFAYLQASLFGFQVPELYKCNEWPCPNQVDCFISRPKEKTLLLYFMFGVSCLCILLNAIELYTFISYSFDRYRKRGMAGRKSVRIADFEPARIVRRYSVDLLDQPLHNIKPNLKERGRGRGRGKAMCANADEDCGTGRTGKTFLDEDDSSSVDTENLSDISMQHKPKITLTEGYI